MSSPPARTATVTSSRWSRALGYWRSLPLRTRVHAVLLPLIAAAAIAHNAILWTWYVEDAAISFAFAKNLAAGEGLVAFVGGERVEGFSNPTWVLLLAFFELFGAESEAAARWLQVGIAGLTIPFVYLLAREAAPREDSDVPIVAAALLAGSTQFAIWGSSGLENGLFNLLLAVALWRLAVEVRTGAWPWSAFWFFLVAISRPEAILYAAAGGFAGMVFQLHARRGVVPTLKWLLTFFLPFGLWHLWRYSYFAWAWPNTYYAKLGDHREPKPFAWDRAGWKYVRDWAATTKLGYFVPVLFLGLTGGRGWRALVAVTATLIVGVTILLGTDQRLLLPVVLGFTYAVFYTSVRWQTGRPSPAIPWAGLALVAGFVAAAEYLRSRGADSNLPNPAWLRNTPPYVLVAMFVLLPLTSIGQRGWQARAACWGSAGVTVFFACYALGDWMAGWRWLSLATVPGAVLLANGAHAVGDIAQTVLGRAEDRWRIAGWTASLGVAAAMIPPNVEYTQWFDGHRVTSPYSVKQRVEFKERVADRLHVEGRITDLDVDQGAHLYWSDFRMLDIAGLVDVPLAHHKFQKPFVREYLFEEEKPHFAHVHGGWASSSKITTHAEWRRDYFEIPGYPAGKSQLHPGNFIRRDLVVATAWKAGLPDRAVAFGEDGQVRLVGWDVPSAVAGVGRRLYVEVGLDTARPFKKGEGFRVLAFVSDGEHLATWDVAPGYDWLKPHEWRTGELFHGRFSFAVPDDLPTGTYDLGFVVLGTDGQVWPAGDLPDSAIVGEAPRYAAGEVVFPGAVELVAPERVVEEAQADHDDALAKAGAGRCEEAEHAWWLARMHQPKATGWVADRVDRVNRAFAECWVARADAEPDLAIDHLARARSWDHRSPTVLAAAAPVADRRYADGRAATAAKDWEAAYRAYSDVLRVDPSRAWARRYAEEARAHRLGIDPETKAKEEAARQQRMDDARRRQDAREAEDEAEAPRPAGPDEADAQEPAEGG